MGGAEQFLVNIAVEYARRGYLVSVYLLTKINYNELNNKLKLNNISVLKTSANRELFGAILFPFLCLRNYVKYEKVFTSHTHTNFFIGVLRFLRIVKSKMFIARESTVVFQRYNGLKLMMFKIFMYTGYLNIDFLICQTEFMRTDLLSNMPHLGKKLNVLVMHNPINIESIEGKLKLRQTIILPSPYIIAAGSLRYEKGFDVLIYAFKEVVEKFPELNLVILGEGSKRSELLGLVNMLNLNQSIVLAGHIENVFPYFRDAEVCVVSSRVEGFPNVLLQMMYSNKKVVSTLCADGINKMPGILTCKPSDVHELADQIVKAYSQNIVMSIEDKRTYLRNFTVKKFVDDLETLNY